MPQPGLHAILALATRKLFPAKRWFALGLVFGALLPDADSYPQAFATILGGLEASKAEEIFHRTFTHSLFFAVVLALVLYLVSLWRGGEALRTFGFGIAVGIALLHTMVDILGWFDGVGILWPLWILNLWAGVSLPELGVKLLRAGNFWAFLVYFLYLAWMARKAGSDAGYQGRLRIWTYLQAGLGVVFTTLAFFLPAKTYNLVDGAIFLFLAFPNVFWVTWKMRVTIEQG